MLCIFNDSSADRFVLFLLPLIYYNFRICSHWSILAFIRIQSLCFEGVSLLEFSHHNCKLCPVLNLCNFLSHIPHLNGFVPPWIEGTCWFKEPLCEKLCSQSSHGDNACICGEKIPQEKPLKAKALDFENLILKVYKCISCRKGFGFWNDIARVN